MNALQASTLSSIYPNPRPRQASCIAELKPRPRWRPARHYRDAKACIAYLAEQRVRHPTALIACLNVQIRRRDSSGHKVWTYLPADEQGRFPDTLTYTRASCPSISRPSRVSIQHPCRRLCLPLHFGYSIILKNYQKPRRDSGHTDPLTHHRIFTGLPSIAISYCMRIMRTEHHIPMGSDKPPDEATQHRASRPHKSALDKPELSS